MHCLPFVHGIIYKESLVSSRAKTNNTTCDQLAVLTVPANNQPFRRTGKVFMTQCPIDDTFVEIKMTPPPHNAKLRDLELSDALKLFEKKTVCIV